MKNFMKFFGKLSLASFFAISSSALAVSKSDGTGITFDFQNRQIYFYGVYSPGSAQPRVHGLDAEIAARRNGISRLNNYIEKSCGERSKEKTEEKPSAPSWQGIVKSQGSEIYANGVLKIALVAPIREIFKDSSKKKAQTLKTKDGLHLALSLPKLPGTALKCGMLALSLNGKMVALNPLSGSTDPNAKTVTLRLEGAANVKPAGGEDLKLLESSNLLHESDSTAEN